MSASKHEETDNLKETLVDTIKINLVYQFKIRIDETNTEVVVINDSNIEQYEKLNEILVNIRRLDPGWSINSNSNKPWSFKYMLENNLRLRILEIDITDLDTLDRDGYENLHDSLRDLRLEDPGWSINNTRRDFPILLTPTDIGLINNHLKSSETRIN
jgi:hypothetical protein